MLNLLPVASGKGGVGKSAVSLNLAITLAGMEKTVILCDLDFGGANLHTMLGLKNNRAGLGHFITRQESSLEALLQETPVKRLYFIAGDCLFPGVANMDFFIKKKLIKELSSLVADYVILDLGAGGAFNILDFFLLTYNSIVVMTPEITSVMNAYSLLKSAIFRFYYRQFPVNSGERNVIRDNINKRMEGSDFSFQDILTEIEEKFPDSGKDAKEALQLFRPQIIMNMGKTSGDLEMGRRLKNLIQKKLNITTDFIGYLPYDETVGLSIAQRKPAVVAYPASPFCLKLKDTAERVIARRYGYNDSIQDDDDMLRSLNNN